MSSAGQIFSEKVFRISNDTSGLYEKSFDVENDGFLLAVDRITGSTNPGITVFQDLPGSADPVQLANFILRKTTPFQRAYVCSRRGKIRITWTGTLDAVVVIKSIGGASVSEHNKMLGHTETPELATKQQIEELISINQRMERHLMAILNHQRYTTQQETPGEPL